METDAAPMTDEEVQQATHGPQAIPPPDPERTEPVPPEQPSSPPEPPAERKPTVYVVLSQTEERAQEDDWKHLGTVEAPNERKAKEAAFLQFGEEQRQAGIKLVAVPARSWKPERAREQEKRDTVVNFD